MKDTNVWYKIIGVLLALSIIFTIITSSLVSITGLTLLGVRGGTVVSSNGGSGSSGGSGGSGNAGTGSSGGTGNSGGTGTAATTAKPSGTGTAATTAAPSGGNSNTPANNNSNNNTPAENNNNNNTPDNNTPVDNTALYTQILADYTTVVNKVKADMPGYTSNDYQDLSNISVGSLLYKTLSLAAGSFLETKDKSTPDVKEKGNYGKWFALPSADTSKVGCCLTDVSAIESASTVDNGDGTKTITITLNKETNPDANTDDPTQCTSAHGRMFDTTSIAPVMEQITSYGLDPAKCYCTYYGTATLTYDAATMQCTNLDHIIDIRVFVGEGKEAKIIADYHFYDFVW